MQQYVLAAAQEIKKTAHWEVDVQVDFFQAKTGANRLVSGLFRGKTLVYSDISHIILRILPKYVSEAGENAILVSSHIDSVFSTYAFFIFLAILFLLILIRFVLLKYIVLS